MIRRILIVVTLGGAGALLLVGGSSPKAPGVESAPSATSGTHPATQRARRLSEQDAEDRVSMTPAVARYLDGVAIASHGRAHGLIFSEGSPPDDPNVWQIYVGADHDDDGAVRWCAFRVNQRTGAVTAAGPGGKGPWISLKQWEAHLPATRPAVRSEGGR